MSPVVHFAGLSTFVLPAGLSANAQGQSAAAPVLMTHSPYHHVVDGDLCGRRTRREFKFRHPAGNS
jgi:hypothetical protein